MSDIYVKWSALKASSGRLDSLKNAIEGCSRQTAKTCSMLHLSDGVDASVKRVLTAEAENLRKLAASMGRYSQALADIAECYHTAEKTNIDR